MSFQEVYLDNAGASLPPKDLLDAVFDDLRSNSCRAGNPHSNPECASRIDDIRALVLHHFGASGDEWDVVFTAGGTASLRLVGELTPFGDRGCLYYPENIHTSALGIRAFAKNVAVFPSSLLAYLSEGELYARSRRVDQLLEVVMKKKDNDNDIESDDDNNPGGGNSSKKELSEDSSGEEEAWLREAEERQAQYIPLDMGFDHVCMDLLVTSGECNFSGSRSDLRATAAYVASRNQVLRSTHLSDAECELDIATAVEPIMNRYPSSQLDKKVVWIRGGHHAGGGYHLEGDYYCHGSTSVPQMDTETNCNRSLQRRRLLWMLDASKLATTSSLLLNDTKLACSPDFVAISFYKMFGYPTGLGALLVRRDAVARLKPQKLYFGGGTITGAIASEDFAISRDDSPHAWLEDGTQHYLGIQSLRHGFDMLRRRGGVGNIGMRATQLCLQLIKGLQDLTHATGSALIVMYGNYAEFPKQFASATSEKERTRIAQEFTLRQGPTVAFNVQWADGTPVGYTEVGRAAALRGIRLRIGCFCNVGACQSALRLSPVDVKSNLKAGRSCWDESPGSDVLSGRPTGAVRASLGLDSADADVAALLTFLRESFLDRLPTSNRSSQVTALAVQPAGSEVKLVEMYIYPVKSCAGLAVRSWPLSTSGFVLDREWVVADHAGRALTLKTHPRLALVKPMLDLTANVLILYADAPEAHDTRHHLAKESQHDSVSVTPSSALALQLDPLVVTTLRTVGASSAELNVETLEALHGLISKTPCDGVTSVRASTSEGMQTVRVCGQGRRACTVSHDADAWFSTLLGFPCRLLRKSEAGQVVSTDGVPSRAVASVSPAFANEAALLLVSRESVARLDLLLSRPGFASISNFRANLVVEGAFAHSEDTWDFVDICGVRLKVDKPCARCSVVNVDGRTGLMDGSTLRTLSTYRRDGGNVYFGQFLSVPSNQDCLQLLEVSQTHLAVLQVGCEIAPQLKED